MSQPTKWTTPASRLVIRFIGWFSSCMVNLWDSAVAVCSPSVAPCNHQPHPGGRATNTDTITRSSEHPIPCSCVHIARCVPRVVVDGVPGGVIGAG